MTDGDSATRLYDPTMMRAEKRVGRVLREKWTLDRLLGVGGMAAVYAATHRNGKRGAIKMLHAELSADAHVRERFLREGRAANHVGHSGAVSVLDDDTAEDGSIFLVMDLLEGESLESRRVRGGGKLDVVDLLSITDQVLDVLVAAHGKGIVHRDLKPDNLFVTREGAVKVLDFGIAKLREAATSNATQSGMSMGTPSFMAQEQARALWSEVDARTDLWAVGATMFTCLTGRVVHEGRTANEQLLAAMTKPATTIRALVPALPRGVADVVDRALAFERDDRFSSASEMQLAIRAAYEAMQSAPISTAPRLVVPDVAVQKTIPSAGAFDDPATQRTDGPVAAGQTGASRTGTTLRSRATLAAATAVLVGGAVLTTALVVRELRAPVAPRATAVPQASVTAVEPAPPAAPTVPSAAIPPPVVASADAAQPVSKGRRRGKDATPSPPPSAPTPAPTPDDPFLGGRHK